MLFGAPSHRIESQLKATALVLDNHADFIHMPSVVIVSFGDDDSKTSRTHFVKANSGLQLGRLHEVHKLYRKVVHDEIGVDAAAIQLQRLMKSKPIYSLATRILLSALCMGLICPLAFGGSVLDTLIASVEGVILASLQLGVAAKNSLYSNIFELGTPLLPHDGSMHLRVWVS